MSFFLSCTNKIKEMHHGFLEFGESRLRAQGVTSVVECNDCIYACVDAMECGDLYYCIYVDVRMLRRLSALKPDLKLFWRTSCWYPGGKLLEIEYLWQDLKLVHAFVLHWASRGLQLPVIQAELSRRLEWMDGTRRAWLLAVVSC
jgi:hypothetical protein